MMNGGMGNWGNGFPNNGAGGYAGALNNFGWFQGVNFTMVLLIGIAILVLFLLFKNKKQPIKKEAIFSVEKSPALDSAEIVRLRYARGEITFEEFQTILKNIQV
ncbi:hypothetical protein ACQYAD_08065 [Neobacillus sp. SM06]|uniref:hypothetical protein n=1 Tax=Neobacillus sp. SM06 TaxID=3422492 RepID=UPI003D2AF921